MSGMQGKSATGLWKFLSTLGLQNARRAVTLALVATLGVSGTSMVQAKDAPPAIASTIALSELPAQGQAVMKLIYQGGPFRYDKDGTVFGNREKLLPLRQRGYYREYTDHYASFRQIVQPGK